MTSSWSLILQLIIYVGIVCVVVQELCAVRLCKNNGTIDDSLFYSLLAQEILCSEKRQGTLNILWGVFVSLVKLR